MVVVVVLVVVVVMMKVVVSEGMGLHSQLQENKDQTGLRLKGFALN